MRVIPCSQCSMTGWYKVLIDKNVWQKCEKCCQHKRGFKRNSVSKNKWFCMDDCGYYKVNDNKFYLGDIVIPNSLEEGDLI